MELSYFTQVFEPTTLLWLCVGAVVGVLLGALPGMSADTGIGIFLPLTSPFLPWPRWPPWAPSTSPAVTAATSRRSRQHAGTSDSLFMTLDGYP
jgi:putative tricarboxylic transport membrane protein